MPELTVNGRAYEVQADVGRTLAETPREEVRHALAGNLCRCAAYPNIEEAVLAWRG